MKARHWRCRVEIESEEEGVKNKPEFFRNSEKKQIATTESFNCDAHSVMRLIEIQQTSASLKKLSVTPPSRWCLSYFTTKSAFKTSHKAQSSIFFTHCALLSNILVKYRWYFCNSANLIKGGGFLIKAKWQIAVSGLFRSLFNQRIAEWEKAITEWIEAGICKEMSGRERGYESHWLKPLIWWLALI